MDRPFTAIWSRHRTPSRTTPALRSEQRGRHSDAQPARRSSSHGVIGLGTGSLAACGIPGDDYRFDEINSAEIPWTVTGEHCYFTFIRDSVAKEDVLLGDGRLSLEAEAARGEFQRFDVLVLDAFSGDAIPTHLLTREANDSLPVWTDDYSKLLRVLR